MQAHDILKRDLDDSDASEHDLSGSSSRNNSPPNKRPKLERTFVPAWLGRYQWLRYDNDRNMMFCELCVKHRKSNAFTEGCQNFRRDNLNKHINTQDHRAAVEQDTVLVISAAPSLPPLSPALPTSTLGTMPLPLTNGVVHLGDPTLQNGDIKTTLPITPNYLASPPFPYLSQQNLTPHIDVPMNLKVTPPDSRDGLIRSPDRQSPPKQDNHASSSVDSPKSASHSPGVSSSPLPHMLQNASQHGLDENELVLKIRAANTEETDFIEVELDKGHLTFDNLLTLMCTELKVDRKLVQKVRKLPDTILRKDKDVKRLRDFQELELVLSSRAVIENLRTQATQGISPRNVGVVLY